MNMFKKLTPSQSLVKQALRGHAWMGLFWAALLYLICFSGALVVFFPEMERWEQPLADEYSQMDAAAIEQSLVNIQQQIPHKLESLYFIYPSEYIPRAHVSAVLEDKTQTIDTEWWLDSSGQLVEPVTAPWTEMLTELHIYLHLPHTLGIIIVGMLGAMMCGLMISGLLAHPNLFKDAFKLRLGSNRHMEQTDIHNRLSVWGLPFFFVVSLTGAYIGLFGVSMTVVDWLEKSHDSNQIITEVFGDDPVINEPVQNINMAQIKQELLEQSPEASPIYLVVQKPGSDEQYVEVAASLPQRLIYSEIYRFHSDGTFIDYQHLSDGSIGRQVAYSSYRVHFGHFGGMATKLLYLLLGLAMTVITATGVNMWFSKRKIHNHWSVLWRGFVWATPTAFAVAAFAGMILSLSAVVAFWFSLLLLSVLSLWSYFSSTDYHKEQNYVMMLKYLTVIIITFLIFFHGFKHPEQSWYWVFSLSILMLSLLPLFNYRKLFLPPPQTSETKVSIKT